MLHKQLEPVKTGIPQDLWRCAVVYDTKTFAASPLSNFVGCGIHELNYFVKHIPQTLDQTKICGIRMSTPWTLCSSNHYSLASLWSSSDARTFSGRHHGHSDWPVATQLHMQQDTFLLQPALLAVLWDQTRQAYTFKTDCSQGISHTLAGATVMR